jgi:hypothetical protein
LTIEQFMFAIQVPNFPQTTIVIMQNEGLGVAQQHHVSATIAL